MGQDNIYHFLYKHKGEWFTNKQLSKKLKISLGSATRSTSKLFDRGSIIHKKISGSHNGYMFMVEAEDYPIEIRGPPHFSLILLFVMVLSVGYAAYSIGVDMNSNHLQATFVHYVNDNLDDPAVALVVDNCSQLSMNESQVMCVSDFMQNISFRDHSSKILTPSELVKDGGLCRDDAVMIAAVFENLGWGYTFTFPLNEHVFTTVFTRIDCHDDSMVDCAIYCNLDWDTYACYRVYDEKK